MIPKIIHQTWKNDRVPGQYLGFQEKVKRLHPDWEYRLWTDADNLALLKGKTPHLYDVYISLPKNIMRADMIRYVIMSKIGGLYLDLDYEMLKPFDLLEYDLVLPYNRNVSAGDSYDGLGNCIFASAPGHPFWEHVLRDLGERRDYDGFFASLSGEPYMSEHTTLEEAITGPAFLTRIYNSIEDDLQNLALPAREMFHPMAPEDRSQYDEMVRRSVAYGIHHCSGSWRGISLFARARRRVGRLLYRAVSGRAALS